jgi:uroporphyrinogen III methyltransferase/synthase
LTGRTVVVTRPPGATTALEKGLSRLGANIVRIPLIRIAPPDSFRRLDWALRRLGSFDTAIFASANAVEAFFSRARALRIRTRPPARVFAVGPGTAAALRRRAWRARIPVEHRAEALAESLGKVSGWSILLPRAKMGGDLLPRTLKNRGAKVTVVSAYQVLPNRRAAAPLRRAAAQGAAVVTFTSGSTVSALFSLLKSRERRRLLSESAAASIGPVTSAALRRRGIRPQIEAAKATPEHLFRAIVRHLERHP